MRNSNPASSRRNPKQLQWRILELVSALFSGVILLFFLLVFTPLGDSLAASGRQALLRSTGNPGQRVMLAEMLESGVHQTAIEACAPELVDSIPCEDPKRNGRQSREMNLYRERHCPLPAEMPLCLVPPPQGIDFNSMAG